jgi:hypothetical protein
METINDKYDLRDLLCDYFETIESVDWLSTSGSTIEVNIGDCDYTITINAENEQDGQLV